MCIRYQRIITQNNNVLILEGELFKYNSSDENYNIKVKVSSYQEGKTIADRFKKEIL